MLLRRPSILPTTNVPMIEAAPVPTQAPRRGATAVEYVCTLAFIISVCFTVLDWLGLSVSQRFQEASKTISSGDSGNNGNNSGDGSGASGGDNSDNKGKGKASGHKKK